MNKQHVFPVLLAATLLTFASACQKAEPEPVKPVRELEMPEKVEAELMSIATKEWVPLIDTLAYFHEHFLKKGAFEGYGPDKVHYELKSETKEGSQVVLTFSIADSVHVTACGKLKPLSLSVSALGTDITVTKCSADSTRVDADKLSVIMPDSFMFCGKGDAALLLESQRVGYITKEIFENEDYSSGKYLMVHYYNDVRTFAFYEY